MTPSHELRTENSAPAWGMVQQLLIVSGETVTPGAGHMRNEARPARRTTVRMSMSPAGTSSTWACAILDRLQRWSVRGMVDKRATHRKAKS